LGAAGAADWANPGAIGATTPNTGVFATLSATGKLTTAASVSGGAGFRMPHGAAPTNPVNGDMWTTTGGLYVRINSATQGPFGAVDWALPGAIGSLQPNTGAFTTLSVSGILTASNTSNNIRITSACNMTTPPAIGSGTPQSGRFTTLQVDSPLTATNAANVINIGTSCTMTAPPSIGTGTPGYAAFSDLYVWKTTGQDFFSVASGYDGTINELGYFKHETNTIGRGPVIGFAAQDSEGATQQYGRIGASIVTSTAGIEAGSLIFQTVNSGTMATKATLDNTGLFSLTNNLSVDGTSLLKGVITTNAASMVTPVTFTFAGVATNLIMGSTDGIAYIRNYGFWLNASTFYMPNLPDTNPLSYGYLWVDSNGFLKVSQG
jgi:hypothetical protein